MSLQNTMATAFAEFDQSGRLTETNASFATLATSSMDELIGKSAQQAGKRVLANFSEMDERPVSCTPADIKAFVASWSRSTARPICGLAHSGQHFLLTSYQHGGGFTLVCADVTEMQHQPSGEAHSAREADAMVRHVLESCPVMILMNDVEDGRIIYRSPATVPMFGEPYSVRAFYAEAGDRDRYLVELKSSGSVDNFQYLAKRTNGETFPASVSGRLINYQGRQVIVSHTRDLSEQVAIEEELERQREIVHQSEKLSALGELLAGVAHELNNPLSVVVGQSVLLKETTQDPAIAERAKKIGNAADRCARIVKSFLAMARQQPARTENFFINDVLESALEVTGYSIRSSDIDVTLRLAPDMPPVSGDPDQLGQVFSNLLINAQQVLTSHPGRRKIKIVTRYERHRSAVIIKIADTGPGIPKHIVSRIFEPFFTTKEVGSGTGIGLAFCHRIVETHDGVIRATSKLGEGTAFFIRLPASGMAHEVKTGSSSEPTSSSKLSVLVVDDETDVADLIAEILRQDGHGVTVANSGAKALREIARAPFSLVLSDLNMPNLDGPSLFEELKQGYPELIGRVAFITGDTMSPKARTFLNTAERPYLDKPIRPAELRKLVAEMLAD